MLDLPAFGLASLPLAYRIRELGLERSFFSTPLGLGWFACVGGLSLLYGLHAFIWHCPTRFAALCRRAPLSALGSHPVDCFAALEILGKFWQVGCLLALIGSDGVAAASQAVRGAPAWCWATFALFVAAGQCLNFAMYVAIGSASRASPRSELVPPSEE